MTASDDYVHINEPIKVKEQPLFGNLSLPCGCRVDVRHDTGDRLVACPGGGEYRVQEPTESGDPLTVVKHCDGGRAYVVTAEPQPPTYFATAASPAMVDRVNSLGPPPTS